MTPENHIAEFTTATVPQEVVEIIRICALDWIACGLAGRNEPVSRFLRQKGLDEGGAETAGIFGGGKLPTARAALVNGATSHALDFDDTHFAHIGHTSVVVMSGALAIAERQGASISQFLEAAAIGSEGAVRIGQWLGRTHYQIGFHQTATSGAFGAVLANARLLGLTNKQTVAALGLVASRAAGLKAQFGTMAKPLNAGLAAEAGVEAVLWAEAGITAADEGLTAFAVTHQGEMDKTAFSDLGDEWRVSEISHKFHACCHGLHATLEAIRGYTVSPHDLQSIDIYTHPRWMSVCNNPDPRTGLEMKFSYKAAAAMSVCGVDTGAIENFDRAVLGRSDIANIMSRIVVKEDNNLSEMQARLSIHGTDGATKSCFHDLAASLTIDERHERVFAKSKTLLGADLAQKVWSAVKQDDLPFFTNHL